MTDAAADFDRAMTLARETRYAEAYELFERAGAQGHGDALAWVGLYELYGYREQIDPARALDLLLRAEQAGSAEASYQLALAGWCGRLVPRDPAQMAARLVAAAERDHPGALRAFAMLNLRGNDASAAALAERCLLRAAALLDPLSYYLLALIGSMHPNRDKRLAASRLMAAAAELGIARAQARRSPGVAPAQVEAGPVSGLPHPAFDTSVSGERQVHSSAPLLETVDRFFTPLECEYLIAFSEPFLHRSVTVADSGDMEKHADRTSSDAILIGAREDFVSRWLQARMCDWLEVPMSRAEHLSLLRYLPGEEYRPHVDYLRTGAFGNVDDPAQPGQRIHTVFTYLDSVESGGQTDFPRIGLRIKPARGRIVHFLNCRADGSPDPLTVHAGRAVEAGTKYLATIWTRERDYRLY